MHKTYAYSKVTLNAQKKEIKRSLEIIRDFDCKTWKIFGYPSSQESKNFILRIVVYPGSLRIDHPINLIFNSGRKTLDLKDINKNNKMKVKTFNDTDAEFDMSILIAALDKNRPLRIG